MRARNVCTSWGFRIVCNINANNIHAINIIHCLTNADLEVLTRVQTGKMLELCCWGLPRRYLDFRHGRHFQRYLWLCRMASIR